MAVTAYCEYYRLRSDSTVGVIFISHSSQNNKQAIEVRDWLRDNGWRDTFLDLDPAQGLAPGQRWQEELKKVGERCSAVAVLISPEWVASKWCQVEFLLASQLGKRIFGIIISPVALAELPTELTAHYQIVDVSDPTTAADGFDRLRWGLKRAGLDPTDFPWPPPDEPQRNPYRGLRTLEEKDAGIFFGREAPITRSLDTLRRLRDGAPERLLVVLGASGAGKSSFLKAGLLARLRRDEENFLVLSTMRPARAALTGPEGLLRALGVATVPDRAALRGRLDELRAPVVLRLERFATAARETYRLKPPTLVLPIDQAEELFGSESHEGPECFDLMRAALGVDDNLVFVLTIRSDSYATLQAERRLADVPRLLFDLPPLSPTSFKQVIEGPGRLTQPPIVFEPALTDRLVADLDQPDALPLLAFTLERLVTDYGGDRKIELKEYEVGLGGLEGAIHKAVEAAFAAAVEDASLPRDRTALEALARRAFIPWLVKVDDVQGLPKRRVAAMGELAPETHALMRHFVNQRLLVSNTRGDQDALEVSHESVLRHWKDLSIWIDEERARLLALEAVRRAADEWHRGRTEGDGAAEAWLVHRGERLVQAEALLHRPDYATLLMEQGRAYLSACRTREEAERAEAEARLRRDQEQIARQRRLQRRAAAALALVAAVTLVFAALTTMQSRAASRETSLALSDYGQRALAQGYRSRAVRFGVLAAREGLLTAADAGAASVLAAAAGYSSSLFSLRGHAGTASWRESADGKTWLSFGSDGTVRVSDATSGREIAHQAHNGGVDGAIFSSDAKRVLSWGKDNIVRVWDASSGTEIAQQKHQGEIIGAVFAADGRRVLSWDRDRYACVWDTISRSEVECLTHKGTVEGALFAPDGKRLLSWSLDTTRVWDAASGAQIAEHTIEGGVDGAMFAPDGRHVLSWGYSTAHVWDATSGTEIASQKHDGEMTAVFAADGQRVLSTSEDGTARVWDATSGKEIALHKHDREARAIFATDGQRVLSWSADGTACVWDAASGTEVACYKHDGTVMGAAFAADGRRVLSWSDDNTVLVWDAASHAQIARQSHNQEILGAMFSADGRRVLSWTADEHRVWDASFGIEIVREAHEHGVQGAMFVGESRRVLSWSADGTTDLWDATARTEIVRLTGDDGVDDAIFAADGRRVLSWRGNTARVWDTATGAEISRYTHESGVEDAIFAADGRRVLSWAIAGDIRVWDAASGREIAHQTHAKRVDGGLFSLDGRSVLSWSRLETTLRVWDAASGTEIARHTHEHDVEGAMFAPNDHRILSWSGSTAHVWDATSGTAVSSHTHQGSVSGATFAADGRLVLSWDGQGIASVWDASSGSEIAHQTHENGIKGAMFAPDSRRVLSWNAAILRVWDANSGTEITRGKHDGEISRAIFAADGRRILSWSSDHTVRVWDATSGNEIARQTHQSLIVGAMFSADGGRVLSWGYDKTARVWDAVTGIEIVRLPHKELVFGAAFSPDGRQVLSWTQYGFAHHWNVSWSVARDSNRLLISEVCERAHPSVRRITVLDAESAPLLRNRVGEDVCAASGWFEPLNL